MTGKSGKFGEKFYVFLYSCCNANNSRAGVQSTILLAVVVWLLCLTVTLKMYQVDKPMMPFLVPDLLKLVKDLLARFVQRDVVESLVTCSDVTGFDTNDIGKHFPATELGFSADKIIRSANFREKKVSDMLGVRTDISVLKAMCKKLLKKTPVTYPVARALSCLDPRNMAGSPEQCKTMMRRLLSACV